MKVLFRGYNPIAEKPTQHVCISEEFQCYECDVKNVNLTYSFSVLLQNHSASFANFCKHYPNYENATPLTVDKNVIQTSGCNNNIILLTDKGDLFKIVCSSDEEKIQYSLQPINKFIYSEHDWIVKIACGPKINVALSKLGKLFRFPDEINIGKIKIKDIAAGREHCVILAENGSVYTFGAGSRGQLGHGTLQMEEEPALVKALDGIKISSIAAGGWHSCALSEEGDLYTWGWNCNGQLGIGDKYSVMATPHIVDFDDDKQVNVVKVGCGTKHTLALLDSNQLYGCGWNKYKQILNEERESIFNFIFCYNLAGFVSSEIVCGPWNSIILCE